MAGGSFELREYPGEIVRLSCQKCGRAGQYRKQNLIERFGADIRLPDKPNHLSKGPLQFISRPDTTDRWICY